MSTEQGQDTELSSKIERLTDEVERLQDEQESSGNASQKTLERKPSEGSMPSRILVFRDGQRREIQNYAVVGGTLWILTEESSRKIAVSDLDMENTKKENAERGLEFP